MTSVKITYKKQEEQSIERVNWLLSWDGGRTVAEARVGTSGRLFISRYDSPISIFIEADDALEWARAILKMVEQRHVL